jgi:L-seryl-tRNA(Ser) seleniumtransferase
VEIGGGFRIPDVMRRSGARMVEVGTTNRTRLADYAGALGPDTALLVKVHRSNFALAGFTEEVSAAELAALGGPRGVPVYEDLGAGLLGALPPGLPREPSVAEAVAAGADVVSFSGDKLLGGPQAGIIVGRRDLVERIRSHPLNRALRIDKLTVAALEATLRLHRDGRAAELPALAALAVPLAALQERAARLAALCAARGVDARPVETTSRVGGGALPSAAPASFAVALAGEAEALHARLRRGDPPVMGRIEDDRLLLDVRALADDELELVADAVAVAAGGRGAAHLPGKEDPA